MNYRAVPIPETTHAKLKEFATKHHLKMGPWIGALIDREIDNLSGGKFVPDNEHIFSSSGELTAVEEECLNLLKSNLHVRDIAEQMKITRARAYQMCASIKKKTGYDFRSKGHKNG